MTWYKPWTWNKNKTEKCKSKSRNQANLESNVSCGISSRQNPDGDYAGRYSLGSKWAGSYTSDETVGRGSYPDNSPSDNGNPYWRD